MKLFDKVDVTSKMIDRYFFSVVEGVPQNLQLIISHFKTTSGYVFTKLRFI